MSKARETLPELDAESEGIWWVTTASGTVHVWDMDKGTVLRAPSAARPLRFDGEPLPIALVTRYPRVGDCAVVAFPHPADPERAVVRTSTAVVSIERAAY